jgi:hypothetical protein
MADGLFFARGPIFLGLGKHVSLHTTSKASELGLGLGLVSANISVRVFKPVLGTLKALGQIDPRSYGRIGMEHIKFISSVGLQAEMYWL